MFMQYTCVIFHVLYGQTICSNKPISYRNLVILVKAYENLDISVVHGLRYHTNMSKVVCRHASKMYLYSFNFNIGKRSVKDSTTAQWSSDH